MSEAEIENDILFQIDMKLYDEFNDKFCEMNEHLGDIYSYQDLNDLEKIEKDTEIELLRQAIEKQKQVIDLMAEQLTTDYHSKEWIINYYKEKAEEKHISKIN